jgi:outer membrane lipoprotein-sorting protein
MNGCSGKPAIRLGRGRRCSSLLAGLASLAMVTLGCGDKDKCVDTSKPALEECRAEQAKLQEQLNDLKIKLAEALANPGTIKVDPSVLMIDGKPVGTAKEGTLTQQQVIEVLRKSKGSLRDCYTRALKRNSALHHGSITLTVGFKVQNSGRPTSIAIRPNRDAKMIDCMTKAIQRWTFPKFEGQSVGVESPVTLTPKQ